MKTTTALLFTLLLCALPSIAASQIVDNTRRQEAIQHYRAGQELMFAEQFEKALQEFERAIELDHLLTLAHYGRGQAFMALKRYASAVQAFTATREAHRTIFTLQQSSAANLDRRADEEIRELRDSINALRSGRIKSYAATAEARITAIEARIRDLERMRQMDTGTFRSPAEVSLALGSAHFRNGSAADAEREWKEAIAVNNRLGEAHNNLAALYAMNRRKQEAEDEVRAAERAGYRVHPQLKEDIRKLSN